MRKSLVDVQKGIKGLVVLSSELDEVLNSLNENKVPSVWGKTFPSVKPLGTWMRDVKDRLKFMQSWAEG